MQGIQRHKVDYVIVIKHGSPYYLPDDDYCFDRLLASHGNAFRVVYQDGNLRIFQVERNLAGETGGSATRNMAAGQQGNAGKRGHTQLSIPQGI